ncbi:MAG: hypothetical protein QOC91_18 [Solirubrobacteraceae bacterium]|jgi:hypothetical protein|nr:hypothetical protein [Solirubrobacteraceae bacterium]MEA2335261.1 hypothetical protein [Solirubrobacteraceae bacterium]
MTRRRLHGRRRCAALGLLATAAALAGCGGVKAPDLFIVARSGSDPAAKLTLLVNEEGGVSCNGVASASGHKLKLSDPQLVEARAIQEDLREPAAKHISLAPAAKSVLSYRVRDEHGSVSFSDNSVGQPQVFRRLALFVLRTSQRVCHLPE